MFDKFTTPALEKAKEAFTQSHLKPPLETLAKAALPLIEEMIDEVLKERAEQPAAQTGPAKGGPKS